MARLQRHRSPEPIPRPPTPTIESLIPDFEAAIYSEPNFPFWASVVIADDLLSDALIFTVEKLAKEFVRHDIASAAAKQLRLEVSSTEKGICVDKIIKPYLDCKAYEMDVRFEEQRQYLDDIVSRLRRCREVTDAIRARVQEEMGRRAYEKEGVSER